MAPAKAAIDETSASITGMTKEMAVGQQGAVELGTMVNLAGEKSRESMYQARGEIGLLGEEFGIRLPRHVRSFVAELPGVGEALSAAFSATAVLFLVEALIKVSEKLSAFAVDTFVVTQAMKDGDAEFLKANKTLQEHADAIKKVVTALDEYGMTATQKTQTAIDQNNTAWVNNTAKIRLNREEAAKLQTEQSSLVNVLGIGTISAINWLAKWTDLTLGVAENTHQIVDNRLEILKLGDTYNNLSKDQQELADKMILLTLQLRDEEDAARKQTLAKQTAFNQTRISDEQAVGKALLVLGKAQADAQVAFDDSANVKRLIISRAFAEAEYQLELSTAKQKVTATEQSETQLYQIEKANLENRLNVQKAMGAAGKEGAAATQVQIEQLAKSHNLTMATEQARGNAQIQAMEKTHEAQLINDAKKFDTDFQQIMKDAFSAQGERKGASFAASMLGTDFHDKFKQAEEDAKALGIVLGGTLAEQATKATAAFKNMQALQKDGVVSAHDLALAELKALEAKQALDKSMGDTSALNADNKAIDDVTKKIKAMEGETVNAERIWDMFSADFKKKAKDMGTTGSQMAKLLADSMNQMQKAFESAITSAILSESSLGDALKKSTAQVLAQIAAQAAVKAIYFTAMGIAELALGVTSESAGEWFAAAAMMAGVAGGAGVAGHALAGGGSGSSSGGSSGSSAGPATGAASLFGSQSQTVVNVPKLSGGGLVTHQTLAIVGDSPGGGDAKEAVIPLNDASAMRQIMQAFAGASSSGGGGVNHNYYIQGMVSTTDLVKLTRMITRGAKTGRSNVTVTNSHRNTKTG
jgi:hypothetical protein